MHNKLLNYAPVTKSVASTGLPTLRCVSQLAKRYVYQAKHHGYSCFEEIRWFNQQYIFGLHRISVLATDLPSAGAV
jgi:hypothetical protein